MLCLSFTPLPASGPSILLFLLVSLLGVKYKCPQYRSAQRSHSFGRSPSRGKALSSPSRTSTIWGGSATFPWSTALPQPANLHQSFWGSCSRASPCTASTRAARSICISKGSTHCIRCSSCRATSISLHQVTGLQCYQQNKTLPKLKPSSSDCSPFPTLAASVFHTWILSGRASWQPVGDKKPVRVRRRKAISIPAEKASSKMVSHMKMC